MNATAETRIAISVSGNEVRELISSARRHWNGAQGHMVQFAAELRQLQVGKAHLIHGASNFAVWAEEEFDGLSAANVKQIVRAGGVAIALERCGRIDLKAPVIGTTGLRALSVVQTKFGEPKMVEVFDVAVTLRPGRVVTGPDVTRACHLLIPPTSPDLGDDDDYDIPNPPQPTDESDEPVVEDERADIIYELQDRIWELLHAPKAEAIEMVHEWKDVLDELLEVLTKTTPVEPPRALLPGPTAA